MCLELTKIVEKLKKQLYLLVGLVPQLQEHALKHTQSRASAHQPSHCGGFMRASLHKGTVIQILT